MSRGRIGAGLAVLTTLAVAIAAPSPARGGEPGVACAAADGLAAQTQCFVNRERISRGLAPLRSNRLLDESSEAHARDMVRRDFFSHTAPGGASPADRIARTGYLRGQGRWLVGENIGWLSARPGAGRAMTRMWMASPPHRAVILERRYRDVGLAAVRGAPSWSGDAVTFVLQTGRRW